MPSTKFTMSTLPWLVALAVAGMSLGCRKAAPVAAPTTQACAAPTAPTAPTATDVDGEQRLEEIRAIVKEEVAKALAAAPPSRAKRRGPDPDAVYSVQVAGLPSEGPANAKVTIVKAYEYACPYCEKTIATMDTLEKRYGKDLRVVYSQFIVHPREATLPARAACAAQKQGKFKAMDQVLWAKGFHGDRKFESADIMGYAAEIGLNAKTFERDLEACAAIVEAQQKALAALGMTGTPGFFINGRFIGGAQPIDVFIELIDAELKKAKAAIAAGTPAAKYYEQEIVAKGLKSLAAD